jgi:heme/copper-type cytochrome/quinol oxidase subunit 4
MTIFGILFLTFTILFGISLNKWDNHIPGRCYNTRGIATPASPHPTVDFVYLSFTCFYMLTTLGGAMEYSIGTAHRNVMKRFMIIQLSMIQYPVHLYMIVTMRENNARFLEEESENEWGFAQIVTLVLTASTVVECVRGARGMYLTYEGNWRVLAY